MCFQKEIIHVLPIARQPFLIQVSYPRNVLCFRTGLKMYFLNSVGKRYDIYKYFGFFFKTTILLNKHGKNWKQKVHSGLSKWTNIMSGY